MKPPKLRDDCFALPAGVDWLPVEDALAQLRAGATCVVGVETLPTAQANGRVLEAVVLAERSNPPHANSAVDGYAFAHASLSEGAQELPLVEGRAAAGAPFEGTVPAGQAVRILTGANLPDGVDTVILQEDVTSSDTAIAFHAGLKKGANARDAGEDVLEGETLFDTGHRLQPQDLALLAAVGAGAVTVHKRLRVGVLSTGDELCDVANTASDAQVYDANRPMLLAVLERWGYEAVDLGQAPDDRDGLRTFLNDGAAKTDAILTSGGASAGDEDHMSAILNAEGNMQMWRIAVKPGRPLAMGLWQGIPVFGLPGNPVAALVCTLIFARPALAKMSGASWSKPQGFPMPAAFTKSKKAGRQEYLRARINASGEVEVFASEGSGRISGLSWADGLIELGFEAQDIKRGTMVRYLPYSSFGI